MNIKKILAWLPIVITALLMWYARSINVGVTNYNIFLLCLLAWCLVIIVFYRLIQGPRG